MLNLRKNERCTTGLSAGRSCGEPANKVFPNCNGIERRGGSTTVGKENHAQDAKYLEGFQ
jgi:hypothetical protein